MQATIQNVQSFWDNRPCNIRHSPEPVGTRAYFDEVEQRKYFVEPHIPRFADFPRWSNKKVLEVGCGIGTDTVNFCRAGADVTAVDLSPESLKLTAKRLEVYGLHAELKQGNAEELTSLPDDEYDLVYSFGVLHHTPNPAGAMAHCRRVLKPGGELRVMLYNSRSYKVLWAWLEHGLTGRGWDWRKAIEYYSEAQTGCPVTYTYNDGIKTKVSVTATTHTSDTRRIDRRARAGSTARPSDGEASSNFVQCTFSNLLTILHISS